MAYNARILSSQEKAMDEYLKRQRANAEQHIHQMYQSPYIDPRHRAIGTKEDGRGIVRLQDQQQPAKMPLTGLGPRCVPSSTPSTPTGRRRNNPDSNGASPSRSVLVYCMPVEIRKMHFCLLQISHGTRRNHSYLQTGGRRQFGAKAAQQNQD